MHTVELPIELTAVPLWCLFEQKAPSREAISQSVNL